MTEVKDAAQLEKIKKTISGESSEDVYTCEMHPQVHQNYMGKCPLCKMDLIKQEKKGNSGHIKTHEDLDSIWRGKPNAIHKELNVPDAKCENYKKILEDALSKDKGVLDEVIDLEEHRVHMYLDKTKTNIDNIEKLILAAGFNVGDKKADPDAHKKLPECGK
jgi:copper chaperone CopZ